MQFIIGMYALCILSRVPIVFVDEHSWIIAIILTKAISGCMIEVTLQYFVFIIKTYQEKIEAVYMVDLSLQLRKINIIKAIVLPLSVFTAIFKCYAELLLRYSFQDPRDPSEIFPPLIRFTLIPMLLVRILTNLFMAFYAF